VSKRSRKMLQVGEDVHQKLIELSKKYSIKMVTIVSYLIDECDKYNMLEPDWEDQLLKVRMDEFKKKFEADLSKDLEKERVRSINRITHTLLTQYLKVLEPEQRKETIENMLGDLKHGTLLESLVDMELTTIDGKKRLVKMSEGKPILGVNPDKIIACNVGFHIKEMFCKCSRWRDCEIRSEEYIAYKAREEGIKRGLITRSHKGSIYIEG